MSPENKSIVIAVDGTAASGKGTLAKKLAALGYATDELLEDATALGGVMNQAFAEELVWLTENSIFNGNGTGQPLGFVGHAATISQAAETGQVAATVVYENIINMWAHLLPRSQRNAAWFVGPDVLPQIDQLGLAVGTGVLPPRFVDYGPDGVLRIKGRPVIVHEYSQALGTAGDIVLADLSSYLLATKGGVRSDTSMHVAFTTDEMAFRAIYRVDGQPATMGQQVSPQARITVERQARDQQAERVTILLQPQK